MVSSISSAQPSKAAVSNNGSRFLENLSKVIEYGYNNGKDLAKYTAKQIDDALNKINARESRHG